jgi:hypothetical protein
MDVFVVLYSSYHGETIKCYGVFTDKASAVKKILRKIAKLEEYYTRPVFIRFDDMWSSPDNDDFWIETKKLNYDVDISLCVSKEPV